MSARVRPREPCTAKSARTGKRCGRQPIKGGFVCHTHGGAARQVKRKAAQRIKDMLAEAIDPDRVLREVGRLAYSDIRRLFDERGNFLPIQKWPDDIAHAVASVEVLKRNVTTGDDKIDDVLKVRLWDKPGKLENLMRHHGQLEERVSLTVTGLDERIKAARKRLSGNG